MATLNADETAALQHWSAYGQKGSSPEGRVTANDWQTKSFEQAKTALWDQSIPYSELPKVLLGFQPKEMEDKWFVYTDGPDAQGNGAMHMHRSWTGHKIVEAKFLVKMTDDGKVKEEDVHFTDITWESSGSITNEMNEERAKQTAKQVCNWCMDIKLP
jgi:hypothetical protein